MAASSKDVRSGAAYVELYVKGGALDKGLRAARARLAAFSAGVKAIGRQMLGLGAGLVGGLVASSTQFANYADTLLDLSKASGLSVETLSELDYVARKNGASLEDVTKAARRMSVYITDAAMGSKTAQKDLAALGLTAGQLQRMSPEEQFKTLADALARLPDETTRTALAMKVFGRSGAALLPMFADGRKGIEALQQRARELGITISTETAVRAEAFAEQMMDLWSVVKAVSYAVASSLVGPLLEVARYMTDLATKAAAWVRENQGLVVSLMKAGMAAMAGGAAMIALSYVAKAAAVSIGLLRSAALAANVAFVGMQAAIVFLASPIGIVVALLAGLASYFLLVSGTGQKVLQYLGSGFNWLKGVAVQAFGAIGDALKAGDLSLAAQIAWAGLRMVWYQGKIEILQIWGDLWTNMLDLYVNFGAHLGVLTEKIIASLANMWAKFETRRQRQVVVMGSDIAAKQVVKTTAARVAFAKGDKSLTPEQREAKVKQIQKEGQSDLDDIYRAMEWKINDLEEKAAGIEKGLAETHKRTLEEAYAKMKDVRPGDTTGLAAAEAGLAKAQEDFKKAQVRAALERVEAEVNAPELEPLDAMKKKVERNARVGIQTAQEASFAVMGGFNVAALGRIGVGGAAERTANACEKMNDQFDDLNKTVEDNAPAWA